MSMLVTSIEIENLYSRFKKLDRARRGYITPNDFYLVPELAMNPLCDRLIALFDSDRTQSVTFSRFVSVLSKISYGASDEEKNDLLFELLDVNGDGRISEHDLIALVKLLTGDNIPDDVIKQIVRQCLQQQSTGTSGNDGEALSLGVGDCQRILQHELGSMYIQPRSELDF